MEITKNKLLEETYHLFMEAGFSKISPDILNDISDDHIMGFGTTLDEKIFQISGLKELLERQKKQSEGMSLQWEIKPLYRHISADENTAIYADDLLLHIEAGSDKLEMYLRFSVILEYKNEKWLVVHWHGSKPEHVESEKDTWGVDVWRQRTEELEKLVSEKTEDLVVKNRELEIEAALERVRSRSMAMHNSADLSVVVYAMFTELVKLDAQLDRCLILIVHPSTQAITWYLSGKEGLLSNNGFLVPDNQHPSHKAYLDGWRTKRKQWQYFLAGEEKKQWDAFGFSQTELSQLPDFIKADMESVEAIHLTISSDDFGCLIASSISPLSAAHAGIVERFAIVFNQTYTRFLDLQKAEAQAREAQIEAALERVRSKTMAMHNSNDVGESVATLFDELTALGALSAQDRCGIGIMQPNEMMELWTAEKATGKTELTIGYLDMRHHILLKNVYQNWLDKKETYQYILEGEDKLNYFEAIRNQTNYKIRKDYYSSVERIVHTDFFFKEGCLYVFSQHAFTTDVASIFMRFVNVFGQTYRRFLDLQKAEAQAREAQIEAALERVRAKTMAMHKSEQLPETAQVLFEQFAVLGKTPDRMSIGVYNEELGVSEWWVTDQEGIQIKHLFTAPLQEPTHAKMFSAWKEGKESIVIELEGDDLKEWVTFVRQVVKMPMNESQIKGRRVHQAAFFSQGQLLISSHEALPVEAVKLLVRFAKVFSQTYTRFLDLQKAEAQAREAQIEAALERVRSKTMAMHKSEQLPETAQVLFEQFAVLGKIPDRIAIGIIKEELQVIEWWATDQTGSQLASHFNASILVPTIGAYFTAWKEGKESTIVDLSGDALQEWIAYVRDEVKMPIDDSKMKGRRVHHAAFFSQGLLLISVHEPMPDETMQLVVRFAKVFNQTYTRFLDLQKAESQARDAPIEAALERVRSRSMAMHKSEELREVIQLMFEQFRFLNFNIDSAQFDPNYKETDDFNMWTAAPGQPYSILLHIPYFDNPVFNGMKEAKKRGLSFITQHLSFEEKNQVFRHFFQHIKGIPVERQKFIFDSPGMYRAVVFMENVSLAIQNYSNTPYTEEENDVLKRFGKTFEQVYTRFLDLQKAEAQAREAKIEAALEKVRSRTMAMQSSNELQETAAVLFEEFKKLGTEEIYQVTIGTYNEEEQLIDFRVTDWAGSGQLEQRTFQLNMNEPTLLKPAINIWKEGKKSAVIDLTGDKLQGWLNYRNQISGIIMNSRDTGGHRVISIAYFSKGHLSLSSPLPLAQETIKTLERFASVFDGTYTRFLDLQKAETQAREATIEASLERVRGKAMAMHSSNDISATIHLVFEELQKLGIKSFRSGVGLISKETRKMKFYSAGTLAGYETDNVQMVMESKLEGHALLTAAYDKWVNQEDYFYVLKGKEIITFYETLKVDIPIAAINNENYEQHGYSLPFAEGVLYGWSEKPFDEAESKILKRFKTVVALTFRRYIELQRAEGNALEASRSASLDRVRAEIASMRSKQDLERITPLIWKELTTLGIPFVRCGVFIMDEQEQLIHTFLSTPDGKAIAAFHVPYQSTPLSGAIEFWRERKIFIKHWGTSEYAEFADAFIDKHEAEKRAHYLSSVPKDGIHLHLLPFMQGMLYVGHHAPLQEDNLILIQSVANAFSTAYARYEDFNKIESAKAQVEKTLADLKQTQTQLVQAEKMASLGELTAGIAHEIQNPLNFVNNFSEVSKELLSELSEEVEKRNYDEVKAIAGDVIQNLEKIHHHGERAASIVRGMLQHSRSSTGAKEPTDINALAGEYIRLAYHGLKAKDKSFNATYITDFDPDISLVQVIPQDMGRVLLNLINNAFYAVHEKKKTAKEGYKPEVIVSSEVKGNSVVLSVSDNGNGIPEAIRDKIFQPFFTTKPTGEGTGLGLSLSYDIIKAHGGELKVESTQGKGTHFIILLKTSV